MIHDIDELYRIQGSNKLLTKEAAELLHLHRYRATHKTHPTDEVKVYDVDSIKIIYMFGEKTWFDTQEELNAYRIAYHKEQEIKRERSKVKQAIIAELDNMSTEQLKAILENMIGVV